MPLAGAALDSRLRKENIQIVHALQRNFLFGTNLRLAARLDAGQEVSSLSTEIRFTGFTVEI